MNRVELSASVLRQIEDHARAAYPRESCGFLFGPENGLTVSIRRIVGSEAAQNELAGTDLLRFLIPSTAVRDVERRLEGLKQALVGFYHSHPGVEALPSECDLDNAWPWYTYLVTRATEGDVGPTRAFEWEPDPPRFVPIDLKVMPSRASVVVPQTLIPNHAPGA